jgi:hypothetical protein
MVTLMNPQMRFLLLLPLLTAACHSEDSGLELAAGWRADVMAEHGDARPDMIVASADGRLLYISCETKSNMVSPSLLRVDRSTGRSEILLYGLHRADGLKIAPDGSLWLGEETADGLIWRINNPASLPAGQRADRRRLVSSYAGIEAVIMAGRFSHEGLAFSADGRFCYLADEWAEGCLYRLRLSDRRLEVLHGSMGWEAIRRPAEARIQAEILHGKIFQRPEDMERIPDGGILIAETGSGEHPGRILLLRDETGPVLTTYLEDARIPHPDNLEWDSRRGWLWITNDADPSELWAWDEKALQLVARHHSAEITGVETTGDGAVLINLQGRRFGPDTTIRLRQTP